MGKSSGELDEWDEKNTKKSCFDNDFKDHITKVVILLFLIHIFINTIPKLGSLKFHKFEDVDRDVI